MPRAERPLDSGDPALTSFAAGLRRLRQDAGSPTYRELARRAHFSSTTLSDAAGGRRLPTLEVTQAYVRACGGDVEEWTRCWHAVQEPAVVAVLDERQLNFNVLVACLLALVVLSAVPPGHVTVAPPVSITQA